MMCAVEPRLTVSNRHLTDVTSDVEFWEHCWSFSSCIAMLCKLLDGDMNSWT